MNQSQHQEPQPNINNSQAEQSVPPRLTEEQINFAKVVGTLLAARWAEIYSVAKDQ